VTADTPVEHGDQAPEGYDLLDLGDGRQLARLGRYVVDRPFPAAIDAIADPGAWATADLRYERPSFGGTGDWVTVATELPEAWTLRHGDLTLEMRPTPSGQVGLFGEQTEQWVWIREAMAGLPGDVRAVFTVLNLFAYTGGATLSAAIDGAAVTHVDASRSAVAWARRNARLSGLDQAPIRWIVDEALAFVDREVRRGRGYNGVILDPPSYGHGPHGERWTIAEHLPELLDACLRVARTPGFVLLTAHAEGLRPADLRDALADAFDRSSRPADSAAIEAGPLMLHAASGARAVAGVFARWRS